MKRSSIHLRSIRSVVGLTTAVFFMLFFAGSSSFALGVTGSTHDMYAKYGNTGDPNVCSYCHMPHNAAGDKIWSAWANETQLENTSLSPIGRMCYTCHDGTVTTVGQGTAFNTTLQQHKMSAGEDCDLCHSVHDNANGKFMKPALQQGSYCAGCHNSVLNAGGMGDYTGTGNHPSYWTSSPLHNTGAVCAACHDIRNPGRSDTCYMCHAKAHGAVNYSAAGVQYPILKVANVSSAYCGTCHPANTQLTTGGFKHPANLSAAGNWGTIECESCHDPHQPGASNHPYILKDAVTGSNFCQSCHGWLGEPGVGINGPGIQWGHDMNATSTGEWWTRQDPAVTPYGNEIDDDGRPGPDYPGNQNILIVCETCHSVHRKGVSAPLLRADEDTLCINCHERWV